MRNLIVFFVVLISMTALTNAQIPNNNFEIWETYSDPDNNNNEYQKPDQWLGLLPNSPSTHSFSIEKNNDSYPSETGEYSMLVKSDTPNGVDGVAFSYDSYPPSLSPDYFPPAFPIDYRPTSAFLYYKYLPVDGDSMHIVGSLFKNSSVIGEFEYFSSQVISEWSLLEIAISYNNTETPDSASIILKTFYETQHNGSKLYIDNMSFDTPITAIDENIGSDLPKSFALMQNYPNPFNPTTKISYTLPTKSNVKIEIFNMLGQSVGILVNRENNAGYYKATWNAENLPSGIYLICIKAEGISSKESFTQTKKALLIK